MNLSCSSRMIKYLMFAFNLFFVISGIIIIAVGATVKTIYSDYSTFLNSNYFTLPNMLIATGALIFVVSFFGCCGAVKESWIMLGVFTIFLCIIFIFELSAGIAGYALRGKTMNYLEQTLTENLKSYNDTTYNIWDTIQSSFHCCGVSASTDWNDTFGFELPLSCCPEKPGQVGQFYCNTITDEAAENVKDHDLNTESPETTIPPSTTTPYQTGCKTAFGKYIKSHAVQIGGCAMGLAVIQIIGIIFSVHLVRQLKNGYYST